MTKENQMLNGFTEMMKGFWNNQDLEVPNLETPCKQEPCDDCVSRETVINTIMPYCSDDDGSTGNLDDLRNVLDDIESLPPIQPKREKGEWIKTQLGTVCNKCYRFPLLSKDENEILSNYCPYCGADMRGKENE